MQAVLWSHPSEPAIGRAFRPDQIQQRDLLQLSTMQCHRHWHAEVVSRPRVLNGAAADSASPRAAACRSHCCSGGSQGLAACGSSRYLDESAARKSGLQGGLKKPFDIALSGENSDFDISCLRLGFGISLSCSWCDLAATEYQAAARLRRSCRRALKPRCCEYMSKTELHTDTKLKQEGRTALCRSAEAHQLHAQCVHRCICCSQMHCPPPPQS